MKNLTILENGAVGQRFVVHMQSLESWGKYAGAERDVWKFKGGASYVVTGVTSQAAAIAFTMDLVGSNDASYKYYPASVEDLSVWLDRTNGKGYDDDELKYELSRLEHISPDTGICTFGNGNTKIEHRLVLVENPKHLQRVSRQVGGKYLGQK